MARSKNLYALHGVLGSTAGMDTNTEQKLTEDDDGRTSVPNYVVDISHLLSKQLGKQMPQMATYRVKGIRLELQNVDNANDNNYALAIGGRINYYAPTEHRIDALQHARQYKRDSAAAIAATDVSDPFGPWSDDKKYKGMRFNWSEDDDGVHGAVADNTTVLSGTKFSVKEIFDHYNQAIGGIPSEEGYDSAGAVGDALWITRTGLDNQEGLGWVCSYQNSAVIDVGSITDPSGIDWLFSPNSKPYELMLPANNHLDVLGGLLVVRVNHTNTDNPRLGEVEDEYELRMTIFVEGWEGF